MGVFNVQRCKIFCILLAQCEYPIYTRLGGREIAQLYASQTKIWDGWKKRCLCDENFGTRNRKSGESFRVTLLWFVAQIEYSHPRKVPRKDTPDLRFRVPKSSFGEQKIAFFVTIGQTITRISQIDRFDSWSVCDIGSLLLLARKITRRISHIDRFDSWSVCDIVFFVTLGQKNHKTHIAHRPLLF